MFLSTLVFFMWLLLWLCCTWCMHACIHIVFILLVVKKKLCM